MATLLLRIEPITRQDEARIESLLRELPGVFGVVASAAGACAEVDFEDDEVDLDLILDRLGAAGFQAHVVG
jgi:copper chaperone CopZ